MFYMNAKLNFYHLSPHIVYVIVDDSSMFEVANREFPLNFSWKWIYIGNEFGILMAKTYIPINDVSAFYSCAVLLTFQLLFRIQVKNNNRISWNCQMPGKCSCSILMVNKMLHFRTQSHTHYSMNSNDCLAEIISIIISIIEIKWPWIL